MADEGDGIIADGQMPEDVVGPLLQMAILTHETYSAFLESGFKSNQALALTMKTLEASLYNEQNSYGELDLDEDDY